MAHVELPDDSCSAFLIEYIRKARSVFKRYDVPKNDIYEIRGEILAAARRASFEHLVIGELTATVNALKTCDILVHCIGSAGRTRFSRSVGGMTRWA